jgi:hypothetical protein
MAVSSEDGPCEDDEGMDDDHMVDTGATTSTTISVGTSTMCDYTLISHAISTIGLPALFSSLVLVRSVFLHAAVI